MPKKQTGTESAPELHQKAMEQVEATKQGFDILEQATQKDQQEWQQRLDESEHGRSEIVLTMIQGCVEGGIPIPESFVESAREETEELRSKEKPLPDALVEANRLLIQHLRENGKSLPDFLVKEEKREQLSSRAGKSAPEDLQERLGIEIPQRKSNDIDKSV